MSDKISTLRVRVPLGISQVPACGCASFEHRTFISIDFRVRLVPDDHRKSEGQKLKMLQDIRMQGVATYPYTGVPISQLRTVNFFFGTNGTGKSTIEKVKQEQLEQVALDLHYGAINQKIPREAP